MNESRHVPVATSGLYAMPEGRWLWVGGMASDVSEAQLIERISAHQAREGSGSTFEVKRLIGGAWVHFTKASLAHVCLTALNGTVLTGPDGSSSTMRIRYAVYQEDTSAPPAVAYLKRPLPSAAAIAAEEKAASEKAASEAAAAKKPSGAAAPNPRGGGDAPAAKRPKVEDGTGGGSRATASQPAAAAAAAAPSSAAPAAQSSAPPASAVKGEKPKAAPPSAAASPGKEGAGAARGGASVSAAARGGTGGTLTGHLPGGPGTHADMLRLALRSVDIRRQHNRTTHAHISCTSISREHAKAAHAAAPQGRVLRPLPRLTSLLGAQPCPLPPTFPDGS